MPTTNEQHTAEKEPYVERFIATTKAYFAAYHPNVPNDAVKPQPKPATPKAKDSNARQ